MATKDWKLQNGGKEYSHYRNKGEDDYFLLAHRQASIGNKQFRVEIIKDGSMEEDKDFKSYSQALSFAKQYMRTH